MNLLPTLQQENVFTDAELENITRIISEVGYQHVDDSQAYPDSGKNGRHNQKIIANNIFWDYHACSEVESVISPKLEKILNKKILVTEAHLLESRIPYLIHTDFVHDNRGLIPDYTVLIPLDTYDSITVCFNEWGEGYNDFEIYKQNQPQPTNLKIEPKFCAERLSHLHPKDLKYLSIHETFKWNKGSVFAMDRRYFHCSDNFLKRGLKEKRALVLWTLS
jgi:hypothetical protein